MSRSRTLVMVLVLLGMASFAPAAETAAPAAAVPAAAASEQPSAQATPAAPDAAADVAAAEVKYAAMIFTQEPQGKISSSAEDLRMVRLLLEDPMVGNYAVDEFKVYSPGEQKSLEGFAGSLKARESNASVALLFMTGDPAGAPETGQGTDFLTQFPGKTKILIEDCTVPAKDKIKPRLTVSVESSDDIPAAVEFRFTGAASEDNSPAGIFVGAMRGDADVDRNHKITLGELAGALEAKADLAARYDLGRMAAATVLAYRMPSELAKAVGPDKALALAAKYADDQRWVESYLMLREITKEKVSDPEYCRISETDQLNLALESRYNEDTRQENVGRGVDDGLELMSDILLLANLHYVQAIDNRDLFAGGARNLELLLANRSLAKVFLPSATPPSVNAFISFLKEAVAHVYENDSLSDTDFQARVKRILLENDATVKLPAGVVVTEFVYGIPASLDPHTDFIPAKMYKEFQDDTVGHFGGLGIEITLEDVGPGKKALTVITPLDGTPAAEAGILPGDRIVKIANDSTDGMKLEMAVSKLRGPIGTSVTITVVHKGDATPFEVTLSRGNILLESIKGYRVDPETGKWEYMLDPVNKIGYVRMTDFKETTPEDLEKVINDLSAEGMKGLVIDLRFNHGGLLTSGIKISDMFISDGTIVSVRGAHTRPFVYKAHYFNTAKDVPLALLINDQSASAAEILAGALKDHHRAILVGEQSFGKGTVQTLYELEHGRSALKLTTAKYYTPSGASIHKEEYSNEGGLTPDVEVLMSDEDNVRLADVWHLRGLKRTARERILDMERDLAKKNPEYKIDDPDKFVDPQLDKAVEILKTRIAESGGTAVAGTPAPETKETRQ